MRMTTHGDYLVQLTRFPASPLPRFLSGELLLCAGRRRLDTG